jgi:hypothetical protein
MSALNAERLNMDEPTIEQKPSIKIIRNTKGYNYEVRVLNLDVAGLKKVTDEIEKTYNITNE